ncbi:pilus assembly protein TadG-related protein [Nocardioides caldifontis]|uniref:pilus assembly protein TadG-related protein n=1 Tax=Nocardioides caldifontis TaxID=2588938 RepID=UPI0011DF8DA0|nr:pilus assembly protein TadG-related protein [Nocardioides caldifontis]
MTREVSRRAETGAVAIVAAALALVLFGLAALVVDLGLARDTRRQAQSAADAAALAAGNALYATSMTPNFAAAVDAAKAYAEENYSFDSSQWSACADPSPLAYVPSAAHGCISFNNPTKPTTVRVVLPSQKVNTLFGAVAGIHEVEVSALAEASWETDSKSECGVCVIGEGPHELQNGELSLSGGSDIHFNGDVCVQQNGEVEVAATDGGQVLIEGQAMNGAGGCKDGPEQYPSGHTEGALPVSDPLELLALPPPGWDALPTKAATQNACATGGGPGVYGSLNIPQNAVCNLSPGLYVVTGQNHSSANGTVVNALGVTLYFACGDRLAPRACYQNGEEGGDLLFTGNAVLNHSAPTCLEVPAIPNCEAIKGLSIAADRNNTSAFSWRGNGSGQESSGTIYLKSGSLDYRGNGTGTVVESLIVVDTLTNSGNNAGLQVKYTGDKNVRLPFANLRLTK